MSKILTLTATGLAGVVLGTGIGIAAAGDTPAPPTDRPVVTAPMDMGAMDMGAMDMSSMDEMHASMRDQMPAEMVEQHDEMHAAMVDHMGDGNRPSGVSPEEHAEHHPDEQEG
tara:strand:- start:218 stop:556 length:339 start_codon:yes stop_codon:yes gene_type:complete